MAKKVQRPQASAPARQQIVTQTIVPETPKIELGSKTRLLFPTLILLAISFGLYFQSLSFGYVLDDLMVIEKNTYVQKGFSGLKQIFSEDSFNGYFGKQQKLLEGGRYRPLSLATFAAEISMFGQNKPMVGHFFNIISYWLTALMLFLALERMFAPANKWWMSIALWASVLFLLHPLHSEAVANIKGRDEILALLFSLMALWAALKYADGFGFKYQIFSGFALFLGLMAKENSITFAAIIPLALWYFKGFSFGRAAKDSWPLFVAAVLFIIVRSKVLGFFLDPGVKITDLMNNPFVGMSVSERLATITMTLGWYIKLLIWPSPLTHDYYPFHVPKVNWSDWRAYGSLLLYVGLIAVAFIQMRKKTVISWSILFFIATTSIISNLVFSIGSFMNERFMFMPSVAFSLVCAWLLVDKIPEWLKLGKGSFNYISVALLGVLAVVYGGITINRVPEWKDGQTLNTTAIQRSPNSARAQCFYGIALWENVFKKETDALKKRALLVEMRGYFDRALQIYPEYGSAMLMQAGVVGEQFFDDNNSDAYFSGMETILMRKTDIPYIDQCMEYVVGRADATKYAAFAYRMGYEVFFKARRDIKNATKYLEYGLKASPNDRKLLEAIIELYKSTGNQTKAAEYQARL